MLERGCGAFDQLCAVLGRLHAAPPDSPAVTLDAMFVWSTIHGIASIFETDAMGGLGITARGAVARRRPRIVTHPRGAARGKIGLTVPNRLAPRALSSEYSRKTEREELL